MKTFFLLLTVTVFVLPTVLVTADTHSPKKPNIILVLIDDMGWSDLPCFGNTAVKTVNIDRLAAEGISFTQFYVSAPICSPSRCALTTGQYPYRWKITSYLDNRDANVRRGMAQWLDPKSPSIARFFHKSGYATGHFGKWHLGGQRNVGDAPLIREYGFDETLTNFEGLGDRVLPLLNLFDGSEPKKYALGSDNLGRGEITWIDRNRVTTAYVEHSLKFIKAAEQAGKPFYVNLWLDDVHSPFFPAAKFRGDESKKDLYHGVLREMDDQLAPLFDYVRSSESLRENTLIVFLSDNGPEPGAGSASPLRGGKGTLYEGGTRSPLIVWGNGVVADTKRGSRNTAAVFQSIDLVRSLLRIADVEVSDKTIFDGEDFSEVLLGKTTTKQRNKPIFWQRPPDRPGTKEEPNPDLALRSGQWKFLMQFDGSSPQLYNIETDQSESKNIAGQEPELVKQFGEVLKEWRESVVGKPVYDVQ